VLTRHVVGTQTAVAAIAQAQSALQSRARPGRVTPQPFTAPTLRLVSAATKILESRLPDFPSGEFDAAISTLRNITVGGKSGLEDVAACRAFSADLAARVIDVRTAITGRFIGAWRTGTVEHTVEWLAMELATLCLLLGRWHPQLSDDVRAALASGPIDAQRLLEVLLPMERSFRVAVVVEGASRLERVAELLPQTAAPECFTAGQLVTGWGNGTPELKALAAVAEAASAARRDWSGNQAGGHVLLTFTVRACDLGGAAFLGRRQTSELLDQYVAGQRIAEIRLRPETLAHDLGSGRTLRLAVPGLGSGPTEPLTPSWPTPLRESLRTAHIARVTEAPMTAAGLCWAALEALEVKSTSTGDLARALSLQATRQEAIDLYQQMATSVTATTRAARHALQAAERTSRRLETADATADDRRATLETKRAKAQAAILVKRAALNEALRVESHRTTVNDWAQVGGNGRLHDPNRWLDVLANPANAEPKLSAASTAVIYLGENLRGETGARLRTWIALLAAPESLAERIKTIAGRFEMSLDWLYALRNTALHDGQYTITTDMLDVHAGRALVDLTLEFLGNWYGPAADSVPERANWTALTVISHLAERQRTVVAKLSGGTRIELNVTHLTSPTSTGWDRT